MLERCTGAGWPESYWRRQSRPRYAADWGVDLSDERAYLDAALLAGTRGNGQFGLRLMAETLPELLGALRGLFGPGSDAALMQAAFGGVRYLYQTRQDLLAQAISRLRAEQTGIWHIGSSRDEQADAPPEPVYDRGALQGYLDELSSDVATWERWFDAMGVTPLRLIYEDFVARPQEALAEVLDHIGCDPAEAAKISPQTTRMSDELSRDWAERYRAGL